MKIFNVLQIFQTSRQGKSRSTFQDTACISNQYASHETRAHVRTCKYMHTQQHRLPSFLGGCFLFTPFPPLFTRGVPPLYPRSSSSSSSYPTVPNPPFLWNRAQPRGWHIGPNQTVSSPLSAFPLEDWPMGLTGNRGGR